MPVLDHCRRSFATVTGDAVVRDVARRMAAENIGYLVVVDAKQRPVGTVTDRDLAMQVLRRGRDPDETTVAEIMAHDPTTLWEDASLLTAFRRMRAEGLRRLPVVEGSGRLVGVLEWDDALQVVATELERAARTARAQWMGGTQGERIRARS